MITVAEAEQIIQSQIRDFGIETVPIGEALGRIIAEDVLADRDLPPCNRVTMDGIAISYEAFEKGIGTFSIIATQAAGDSPSLTKSNNECVEIMTGAALPETTDTVVRYEDIQIENRRATVLTDTIKKGQNIHSKGIDKKQFEVVLPANNVITPAEISLLASVGKTSLLVKKMPEVVVISTGDEVIDINKTPLEWQVRSSNSHTIKAVLKENHLQASLLHLPDDPAIIENNLKVCLQKYNVILISGGISMGKFDYIHQMLDKLLVTRLFYKVQQRPGKLFWFGKHNNGTLVFAFPGNPVSAFMCLHRYFLPWLQRSLTGRTKKKLCALLDTDFTFNLQLQYFLQVKLYMNEQGKLMATPIEGHGSGDFANLTDANAFIELPLEQNNFKKGEVYLVWPFKQLI